MKKKLKVTKVKGKGKTLKGKKKIVTKKIGGK